MALAAINHIVITPGTYNPLIIWGGTGVGKTHLVQGYCRAILEADPTKRVVYQTGEQFALSYQKAISERSLATMETWRNRLRKADVLVIDNVQFLARGNKVATQEEFLNTLDFLHNRGAQIVLTLDIAPELCEGFSKGVLSRICSGLNTPIDPPDNQYRQNIIASKWGERHSTALSAELLAHLAQHTAGTSPRDIEGIVQRLSALVDLSNAVLNRQTVDKALGLTVRSEQPRPNLRQIGEAVASVYDIELSKLTGNSRAGNLRLARQVAYLMCRKLTAASLSEIGQFFGKRAHSTILSALKGAPNNWSKETLVYLKNAMAALGLQLRALGDIFEQGELGL